MKKTTALGALEGLLGSFGQPSRAMTGKTPGVSCSSFMSTAQPAKNSCSPGPWLGRPATSTILVSVGVRRLHFERHAGLVRGVIGGAQRRSIPDEQHTQEKHEEAGWDALPHERFLHGGRGRKRPVRLNLFYQPCEYCTKRSLPRRRRRCQLQLMFPPGRKKNSGVFPCTGCVRRVFSNCSLMNDHSFLVMSMPWTVCWHRARLGAGVVLTLAAWAFCAALCRPCRLRRLRQGCRPHGSRSGEARRSPSPAAALFGASLFEQARRAPTAPATVIERSDDRCLTSRLLDLLDDPEGKGQLAEPRLAQPVRRAADIYHPPRS